jgi:hypothetical protein
VADIDMVLRREVRIIGVNRPLLQLQRATDVPAVIGDKLPSRLGGCEGGVGRPGRRG